MNNILSSHGVHFLLYRTPEFISTDFRIMHPECTGLHCLHINPGAAGKQGWQQVRTLVKFTIDGKDFKDLEVIELS